MAMVEVATASLEELVQCVEDKIPYTELEDLASYIQWTFDVQTFERAILAYNAEVLARSEKQANKARMDFQIQNATMCEKILWDWCPLWRILVAHETLLYSLPHCLGGTMVRTSFC